MKKELLPCLIGAILLLIGSPLLVSAQKIIELEDYKLPGHATSSKVSQNLIQLAETYAINARQSSSAKIYDYPDALKAQGNYVFIEAAAKRGKGAKLLAQLKKEVGLQDGVVYKHIVSGKVPLVNVKKLEDIPLLQFARPAYRPQTKVGLVTSRGDIALKSDKGREKFGVDGSGQKIGILSDSYNSLGGAVDGVTSGDLPTGVEILADLPAGNGTDEGRAMAEIIHDIAPGADLAFHTAFGGQSVFAQGILNLAEAGSSVIVDDVGYFAEPFFQDGIISQAVDEVAKQGVVYFSSAGNSAQQSYESSFNNLGFQLAIDDTTLLGFPHDFGGGDIFQRYLVPPGGSLILSLQWSDPYFSASGKRGAHSDLDLYLLFPQFDDAFVAANNNIGGDPIEVTGVINTSDTLVLEVDVLITKFAGDDPALIKYINFGDFAQVQDFVAETQAPTIYGHSNAADGIAVGATAWFNVPKFNSNVSRPVINSFSSKGGIPILFKDNGKSREPEIRNKPEMVGPDGVNTTFFSRDLSFAVPGTDEPDGFPNFFGTSASAPHLAGVAALMKQLGNNSLERIMIERLLMRSAIDMDDPTTPDFDEGFDFKTGRGFINAKKALELVTKEPIPMAAVRPVLETITYDTQSGNYLALFGYLNENSSSVFIPIGENNKFVPKEDRGQVEEFLPGRQFAAFDIMLEPGKTAVWQLEGPDGKRRTATATAPMGEEVAARFDQSGKKPETSSLDGSAFGLLPGAYIYPNPTSGKIFLEVVDAAEVPIQVNVFNAIGQSIFRIEGRKLVRESVDLRPYGQGLYIVRAEAGSKVTTRRILVE